MKTLKALTTLALERGRVEAGQVFGLHNETAARQLIDAGLAEETTQSQAAKQVDGEPDVSGFIGLQKAKEEKTPVKTKEEKETHQTKDAK